MGSVYAPTIPSTATPQAVGTAAAGTSTKVSADDHVHNAADQTITSRMVTLTSVATQLIATAETTTSATYANLTTTGPSGTLSPGVTQTHMIFYMVDQGNSGTGGFSLTSVAIAGAAASDNDWLLQQSAVAGSPGTRMSAGGTIVAAAQSSGATHTMKYRTPGNTSTFQVRRISAVAC